MSSTAAASAEVGYPASPISADRPSFGTGPTVLAGGRRQVEVGYLFTRDDGIAAHGVPLTLLRIGLGRTTEVRLGWEGALIEEDLRSEDWADVGLRDFTLGFKAGVTEFGRGLPALALFGQITIPSGDDPGSSGSIDPTFGIVGALGLPGIDASVFGNALVRVPAGAEGDRSATGISALGVAFGITERIGVFGEYYGVFPAKAPDRHAVDFGVTYLISPNFQVDVVVGGALDGDATDLLVGAGLARRWGLEPQLRQAYRGTGSRM